MLGILFFLIAICAWLAKQSLDHDQNYTAYKKLGTDKYGCWKDGYNMWHWGNKGLTTFFIHGHEILAVPDLFSFHNYEYSRYKYVVRDLTLEAEIQRECTEIKTFYNDMTLRKKAIEEGKKCYKPDLTMPIGRNLYRRVDDNRLYALTYLSSSFGDVSYWFTMHHYVINQLSAKIDRNGQVIREIIEREKEDFITAHSYSDKCKVEDEWGRATDN